MALGEVLLPPFGIAPQVLIVPVEPAQELLPLQGVDGCVNDVDHGGLASLGQRLEALGVGSTDPDGCRICCHGLTVDDL